MHVVVEWTWRPSLHSWLALIVQVYAIYIGLPPIPECVDEAARSAPDRNMLWTVVRWCIHQGKVTDNQLEASCSTSLHVWNSYTACGALTQVIPRTFTSHLFVSPPFHQYKIALWVRASSKFRLGSVDRVRKSPLFVSGLSVRPLSLKYFVGLSKLSTYLWSEPRLKTSPTIFERIGTAERDEPRVVLSTTWLSVDAFDKWAFSNLPAHRVDMALLLLLLLTQRRNMWSAA